MKIEVITNKNIANYLSIMSSIEVIGIEEERYSGFGAFDEETGDPIGKLFVLILPEYIRIVNLFVVPERRNKGVGTKLLDFFRDVPAPLKMPIFYFSHDNNEDVKFLLDRGFKIEMSKYEYVSGRLCDLAESMSVQNKDKEAVYSLARVPYDKLNDFMIERRQDEFLQFPDVFLDTRWYFECSPVYFRDHEIVGAALIKEMDDGIEIVFFSERDEDVIGSCLAMIKKSLIVDYDPSEVIRVLIYDKELRDIVVKFFSDFEENPIQVCLE